jgi:hypothetical protein
MVLRMRIGRQPSLMSLVQEAQVSSLHTRQIARQRHDEARWYRAGSKKIIVDDRFGSITTEQFLRRVCRAFDCRPPVNNAMGQLLTHVV